MQALKIYSISEHIDKSSDKAVTAMSVDNGLQSRLIVDIT